ncbi:hypothetical protein PSUB009319_11290 [Ralstonia sp. SET104]|nr:hypothetical protein PSUB009319_11290 [Ralstonia sp. SET104]
MLFGAMFGALANFIYGKILAPVMTVGKWRLDFRRWILPFLMCAFVPFFASFVIGALLSRNPAGPVFLMLANMFLTPLTFAFLAARLKEFRIEHVCFSALLLWFIAFPITLANGQPLAFWMGSYLSSAPLAMGGYLIAQGYAAVRAGLVSA